MEAIQAYEEVFFSGDGIVTINGDIGNNAIVSFEGKGELQIKGTVHENALFHLKGKGTISFLKSPPKSVREQIKQLSGFRIIESYSRNSQAVSLFSRNSFPGGTAQQTVAHEVLSVCNFKNEYKDSHTEVNRKETSANLRKTKPDHIPVIVQGDPAFDMRKKGCLVLKGSSLRELLADVKKAGGKMPHPSLLEIFREKNRQSLSLDKKMIEIDNSDHIDGDGFLYLIVVLKPITKELLLELGQRPSQYLKNSGKNLASILRFPAISECHCSPILSRGLNEAVNFDLRKFLENKLLEKLQVNAAASKGKPLLICSFASEGFFQELIIHLKLIKEGFEVNWVLVDPLYFEKGQNPKEHRII